MPLPNINTINDIDNLFDAIKIIYGDNPSNVIPLQYKILEMIRQGMSESKKNLMVEELSDTHLLTIADAGKTFLVTQPNTIVSINTIPVTIFKKSFFVNFLFMNATATLQFVNISGGGDPLTTVSELDYVYIEGKGAAGSLIYTDRNTAFIDGDLGVTP